MKFYLPTFILLLIFNCSCEQLLCSRASLKSSEPTLKTDSIVSFLESQYTAVGYRFNGSPEGVWYLYDGNQIKGTVEYNRGLLHGTQTLYYQYPSQLAQVTNWYNNQKHGFEKVFFKNGRLYKDRVYSNGLLSGTVRWYTPNGILFYQSEYENGKKNGSTVDFSPYSGDTIKMFDYERGNLLEKKVLREDLDTVNLMFYIKRLVKTGNL